MSSDSERALAQATELVSNFNLVAGEIVKAMETLLAAKAELDAVLAKPIDPSAGPDVLREKKAAMANYQAALRELQERQAKIAAAVSAAQPAGSQPQ